MWDVPDNPRQLATLVPSFAGADDNDGDGWVNLRNGGSINRGNGESSCGPAGP